MHIDLGDGANALPTHPLGEAHSERLDGLAPRDEEELVEWRHLGRTEEAIVEFSEEPIAHRSQ